MPHGPPPVNRRDRRPARVTQLERNARIAQLGRGGRPGHRQRPNAAAGFPMPSPRGATPASRRDRRPARNIQPGRNARIAQLDVGRRHRRGARPGHRRRSNTATGFPTPSPRGPSPASRRDRRPARNIQLERNARIAQLERGGRHRRGRRQGHGQRPNTATGFPKPSPRGPSAATVATAAPRGTPSQGAMHALRGLMSAAATVAAPALATVSARTPPPVVPRSRRDGPARYFGRAPAHRGTPSQVRRSRCARSPMAAATVAAPTPAPLRPLHSVLDPPCALAPSRRPPNPRTGAGFPHNHRSPRFIRFPQPTPLWKTARGRRSCDVDPSQRRSGPVDMWKTCVA